MTAVAWTSTRMFHLHSSLQPIIHVPEMTVNHVPGLKGRKLRHPMLP